MVFDDVNTSPEQEFELITDLYGVHEYPVRYMCAHFTYKIYKIFRTVITDKMLMCKILKLHTRFRHYKFCYRTVKFSSVQHLSLLFVGDRNMEQIKIYYIGLKGEWTPTRKHGVTICAYEARPLISDHPTDFNEISRVIK